MSSSPILEYWFHIFQVSKLVVVTLVNFQDDGAPELGKETDYNLDLCVY